MPCAIRGKPSLGGRKAADRVRRSEARLQAAVDLVGLSPYAWDPATGALEWDDRLRAMWGLPPGAHVDTEVFLAGLHPDDRSRVEAAIARCVDPAGDGVYALEYRVIGIRDGVERWVSTHGSTAFEQGRPVSFVGAALDITERKRAGERLRASEERFRQLANMVPAFVWFTDAGGMVRYFNDRWYEYTGQTPEQALADGGMQAVHPDDVEPVRATWEKAARRGVLCESELRCRRHDGVYRWYMARVEPLRDDAGRITGWFGASTDIHDRKLAEEALRSSEERFRQFAENLTDVLWIIDVETMQVEYVIPAYERVWGEPRDATTRDWKHWAETVHPDDRERAIDALERVLGEKIVAQDYRIVRPDGAVRWIRDRFFPIRDEQGRVRRAAGIAQDLTGHGGSLVYLVDANDASCQARSALLHSAGYRVKPFGSARAFLEVAPVLIAGCVLLDIRAPESGGLAIPKEFKARRTTLPVIVMGDRGGDVGLAVRAMKAGAVDFLEVPCEREALLASVASALADVRGAAEHDRTAELARARVAAMSAREREVLSGVLAGGTNKTIAKDLGISPRTVEVHRAHAMERLGVRTLPEAVLTATAAGLQPPPRPADHPDRI